MDWPITFDALSMFNTSTPFSRDALPNALLTSKRSIVDWRGAILLDPDADTAPISAAGDDALITPDVVACQVRVTGDFGQMVLGSA